MVGKWLILLWFVVDVKGLLEVWVEAAGLFLECNCDFVATL